MALGTKTEFVVPPFIYLSLHTVTLNDRPQNPQGTDLSTSITSISSMFEQPTLKSLSLFVKLFLHRSFEKLVFFFFTILVSFS